MWEGEKEVEKTLSHLFYSTISCCTWRVRFFVFRIGMCCPVVGGGEYQKNYCHQKYLKTKSCIHYILYIIYCMQYHWSDMNLVIMNKLMWSVCSWYVVSMWSVWCVGNFTCMSPQLKNVSPRNWKRQDKSHTSRRTLPTNCIWFIFLTLHANRHSESMCILTMASSFPAAFLNALVHFTLRGLRFNLKFLWHFDRQNLNVCAKMRTTYFQSSHGRHRKFVQTRRSSPEALTHSPYSHFLRTRFRVLGKWNSNRNSTFRYASYAIGIKHDR